MDTAERWQRAENRRDQLQAEQDRFDAMDAAGLGPLDEERAELDGRIMEADRELAEAEAAFHAEGGPIPADPEPEPDRLLRLADGVDAMTGRKRPEHED